MTRHIRIVPGDVDRIWSNQESPSDPVYYAPFMCRGCGVRDIDDLQRVVEQNRGEREKEAHHAERIVAEELRSVNDWLRSLEVVPTIASLRETVEQIRRSELERLGAKLSDLTDEQRAQVEMLTTSIVNKILHMPTVKMKEAAGRDECYLYVDAVRTLFDLSGNGDAPAEGAPDRLPADDGTADGPKPHEPADARETAEPRDAEEAGATVHELRGTGTEDA